MKSEQEVLEKIGKELQALRIKAGFTSYESFAHEYEISRMMYWKIEKGKTNITIRTLLKILTIHKIEMEDFFAQMVNIEKPIKKKG